MDEYAVTSVISHWVPIVTICPVSKLPDVFYFEVETEGFVELYAVRKLFRQFYFREVFMEDAAEQLLLSLKARDYGHRIRAVRVRLLFSRHVCEVRDV